jgi:hypothetical protein
MKLQCIDGAFNNCLFIRLVPELPLVKTTGFAAKETNRARLNANLGVADDPATKVLVEFMDACLK